MVFSLSIPILDNSYLSVDQCQDKSSACPYWQVGSIATNKDANMHQMTPNPLVVTQVARRPEPQNGESAYPVSPIGNFSILR